MKKKKISLESKKSNQARLFLIPWELGLILFFLVPLLNSIIYSFCDTTISAGGLNTRFAGFKYYRYLFFEDTNFMNNMRDSIGSMAYSLPVIVALSLILAVVLNKKFKGRIFARAVFFLPVIIASGVIMTLLSSDSIGIPLFTMGNNSNSQTYTSMIDFEEILGRLEMPAKVTAMFSSYIANVFGLIWNCGVQTVLFIAGLQTVPSALYEVSKVEGANRWQEFWFITVPMMGQVILLVIVFTLIELLTAYDNPVMTQVYAVLQKQQVYDRSSAMLWSYFLLVAACMGIILFIYKKACLDRWSSEGRAKE